MINTGKRTIYDVMVGHAGHNIDIVKTNPDAVEVWCKTCNLMLLKQEAPVKAVWSL